MSDDRAYQKTQILYTRAIEQVRKDTLEDIRVLREHIEHRHRLFVYRTEPLSERTGRQEREERTPYDER